MKIKWIPTALLLLLIFLVSCTPNETAPSEISLPENIPAYVQPSDFEAIDWDKKAMKFGEAGIIGNENKSGVIGVDAPSLTTQKWMWHVWGIEQNLDTKLTVVGVHKDLQIVHPILTDGGQSA